MKFLSLLIALLALSLGACERHSWEDQVDENGIVTEKGTKRLFPAHEHDAGHDAHGGADGPGSDEAGHEGDHGGDHANDAGDEKPEGGGAESGGGAH